ncbi:hypothetical protein COCMIDRAFT_105765 [Bipolaris oryzae ATCC 44560]|uniref:BZIP domain-containing protein n=1 Tax=Bipolaris oryzae ATCC 44560 TaxID=930090 RepID=W6YVM3_COCMI|nr:uncharacterized protein COCMIDRAFT_105765 [Bipolaris oryzae ATCC 44560]EUC41578.1 hypothetical protein COCMIDRAFT_105765 [Bipolaris oryzae ATCC 44560]
MCAEDVYRNQRGSPQQPVSSTKESSMYSGQTSETDKNDWSDVSDRSERRKIQNKLAQRRFRDRVREQREEAEREEENQRKAGASYAQPKPEEIDTDHSLSGLPWGGISMKHMVEQGKQRRRGSQKDVNNGSTHHNASSVEENSSK